MAIEFVCPACGGTLRVGDESAGRVIRCGGCMSALRVPAAAAAAVPDPPAAPNPYDNGRAFPQPASPPPPPPPSRRAPAPTDVEPLPDDPPAARPVSPRRRDRDDPSDDRRERRSRRGAPPPSSGYGVFFWLVVIGAVMMVGLVGCCGGLFLIAPDAKWQQHESKDGGFKVELPGSPKPDVAKATGLSLEKDTRAEGTVLLRRAEKFVVIYRDIKSTKERLKTDDQELDERVEKLRKGLNAEQLLRNESITVGGFPGREIEFQTKGNRWYVARVIVADTRVYIVLVGGGMAHPDDADVRRFLDSFEITEPKLVEEGKRRTEAAKNAADGAKEAKNRAARAKAEAEAEAAREVKDLRDAAEAVAKEALAAANAATPARPPLPVAPPPRPVED